MFPKLKDPRYPELPEELVFLHAEEILQMFPDLPRKQRETQILQKYPAVFIVGIGYVLDDGYPHEMRAADYDDWITPSVVKNGKQMHGLNGDILVWNPITKRRHELSSMGIRVTKDSLVQQLKAGGGIGQSRTTMLLLKKAHLGEVSVTVWPKQLKDICEKKNIFVL